MDKIKKRNSLKWRILLYIPIPFFLAIFGAYFIGHASNSLQNWYMDKASASSEGASYEADSGILYEVQDDSASFIIYKDSEGVNHLISYEEYYSPMSRSEKIIYFLISNAQVILVPLWVIVCITAASFVFYKREIESGINILLKASEKITNNELEFEMPLTKKNEIGLVCESFETMRSSLYEASLQNIRLVEESKRLNAAFSHDIRTPITVLKGYVDLLEKYVPEGKIDTKKENEILGMMSSQVSRLENYALSMSSVQKLDELAVVPKEENFDKLCSELMSSLSIVDKRVAVQKEKDYTGSLKLDKELVFEAVENIVSNAGRYARERIIVQISCDEDFLSVEVTDDGEGFSEKVLSQFGKPYLREDKALDKDHFGLGMYMSRLICEKCGGNMSIANKNGAYVKISFKNFQ